MRYGQLLHQKMKGTLSTCCHTDHDHANKQKNTFLQNSVLECPQVLDSCFCHRVLHYFFAKLDTMEESIWGPQLNKTEFKCSSVLGMFDC